MTVVWAIVTGVVVVGISSFIAYLAQHWQWRRDRRADAYAAILSQLSEYTAWRSPLLNDPEKHPPERDWRLAVARLRLFGTTKAHDAAQEAYDAHIAYMRESVIRRVEIANEIRPLSVSPAELSELADAAFAAADRFRQVALSDLRR